MKLGLKSLVAAAALVAISGCAHKDKKADQPPPTPQEQAVAGLSAERDGYVSRIQTRVDELTKYAGDLRTQAAAAQKPRSKKLENAADDMDSVLKDVSKEMADVKNAAPENWMDEKRDVDKIMMRAETQYSNSIRLLK